MLPFDYLGAVDGRNPSRVPILYRLLHNVHNIGLDNSILLTYSLKYSVLSGDSVLTIWVKKNESEM